VKLGSVSTQLLQVGSAAAFVGQGRSDALTIGIPLGASRQCLRIDGEDLHDDSFLFVAADRPFALSSQRPVQWTTIKVPMDEGLIEPELLSSVASHGVSARAATSIAELERVRITLRELFAAHSNGLLEAEACRFAKEEIVSLMSRVLEGSGGTTQIHAGRPQFARGRVLARALEVIEQSEGKPLFLIDLCRATQVSERTLRRVFEEYFGVSPMRLLRVRQLQEFARP